MDESILNTVKRHCNVDPSDDGFDQQLINHINSVFSILYQLGVGPQDRQFTISDATAVWDDFIGDVPDIEMVRSYVGEKVRMLFDPPSTSSAIDACERNIKEMEARLNMAVDYRKGV